MKKQQIPEYPGFTPEQNFKAWKLRCEIVDNYITNGLLDKHDLVDLSNMPDDISRTVLLLSILSKKKGKQ